MSVITRVHEVSANVKNFLFISFSDVDGVCAREGPINARTGKIKSKISIGSIKVEREKKRNEKLHRLFIHTFFEESRKFYYIIR